uniref:arginine decarboxylase n=1 Tax=viral metagenome TaxID=1070528 RepID=A0A6C0HSI2_9ZZZZ
MILGNRIPYEYFATTGKGQSAAGSEGLKYETGSYDAALTVAGIENCNVIEYTSVIPTGAKQISKEEGLKRLKWGEVMECIKAQSNGDKGSFISAAVITTDVYNEDNTYLGGFALEYSGSGKKEDVIASLSLSLKGLIQRRGYGTVGDVEIFANNKTSKGYTLYPGKIFIYESMNVKEEHGTVFAALCWVSYKFPTAKKGSRKKTRNFLN